MCRIFVYINYSIYYIPSSSCISGCNSTSNYIITFLYYVYGYR